MRIDSLWALLLVAGSCILLMYGLLARVSPRRMLACLLALTVLTVGVGLPLTRRLPRLEISAAGSGAALVLRQGGKTALLVSHGDGLADAAYRVEGLDLDLLFVGGGAASDGGALADLIRDTDAACVYTTAPDGWTAGIPYAVSGFYSGDALRIWGRYVLSMPTPGWWRLETEEAALLLCTDLSAPPPEAADGMVVYAGGLPRQPLAVRQSVLVCSEQWLATARPESVDRRAVLTDQSVTFTPRSTGEWSVLPWL